jgi:plastocyanin
MHHRNGNEASIGRRRGLVFAAVVGVGGLLVVGCGDGEDDTGEVDATTIAPTTAAPTTAAPTTADTGDAAEPATTIDIVSISAAFDPASATVAVGDEVTWTNTDGITHTATATDGAWDSGGISAGGEFTFTAEAPGTYPYRCTIHPSMTGELVVE